jgi:hypothetical protein
VSEEMTTPVERRRSRRELIAGAAGAVGVMAAHSVVGAQSALAADGDPILLGEANHATLSTEVFASGDVALRGEARTRGLFGHAGGTSGDTRGVYGEAFSPSGSGVRGHAPNFGVYGLATNPTGTSHGVHGQCSSTSGRGVFGLVTATSGLNYGVYGRTDSPSGYGVLCEGRFKSTGRSFLGAPNSAPGSGSLSNGMLSFYLDEANNRLRIRVRYSNGTLKTGSVALA